MSCWPPKPTLPPPDESAELLAEHAATKRRRADDFMAIPFSSGRARILQAVPRGKPSRVGRFEPGSDIDVVGCAGHAPPPRIAARRLFAARPEGPAQPA